MLMKEENAQVAWGGEVFVCMCVCVRELFGGGEGGGEKRVVRAEGLRGLISSYLPRIVQAGFCKNVF